MSRDVEDFAGRYVFSSEPGYADDGTFTPDQAGQPAATPVTVTPPPAVAPPVQVVVPPSAAAVAVPVPTPRTAPTILPVPVVVGNPRYSAADYAAAARSLLPRGRAWPTDPDSVLEQVLLGIGQSFERIDAAASALLGGSLPGQLTTLLPEWESALDLPDPCVGDNPSLPQRLDQVRGKFVGAGGQSRQHFLDFAAALGFVIEIVNFAPFRVGITPVGSPINGDEWSFVWGIQVIATTGALSVDVLFCELNAVKPAESTLIFLGDDGNTVLAGPDGRPLLNPDGTPLLAP